MGKKRLAKVKESAEEFTEKLELNSMIEAQGEFIEKVMEWESCSRERAMDLCLGNTDPIDYGYTLGYKMQNPLLNAGLFGPNTRAGKMNIIRQIEAQLCPEEIELFRTHYLKKKCNRLWREEFAAATEKEENPYDRRERLERARRQREIDRRQWKN